jgi:hypothetical protein
LKRKATINSLPAVMKIIIKIVPIAAAHFHSSFQSLSFVDLIGVRALRGQRNILAEHAVFGEVTTAFLLI